MRTCRLTVSSSTTRTGPAGTYKVYHAGEYEILLAVERKASKLLPRLDLAWMLRFVEIEPQSAAVRALRDALGKRRT